MNGQTIRDRLWLWGMQVNVLQEANQDSDFGRAESTMTVRDAIQRTGITNVILGGGLPMDKESLALVPAGGRIICKTELHSHKDGKPFLNYERCLSGLLAAKKLASEDARIEAFLLDDFSTGSVDAGAKPEHLTRLQFANEVSGRTLHLASTMYTMSLDLPELPGLLPHFGTYLVPLWDADQIETLPGALSRLTELSGGKPMMLCLYMYDFGGERPISRELMQRHLDIAEQLLREERVTGLCMCGTCMMDLDWDSNHVFYDWLDRVGDHILKE